MARKTLKRSLISVAEAIAEEGEEERALPAPTGAWRAGATAQLRGELEAREAEAADAVLEGRAELALAPEMIDDPLGTDRRPDWQTRPEFVELKDSIALNGQDVPVHVTPADPGWRPNPRAPFETGDTRFLLLAGRRRLAALQVLGKPVRAIIAPVEGEGAQRRFAMLARRWRENAERADLSPFERLLAIGEMFEAAKEVESNITAAGFGERIGVSESVVSRARAVSARREDIRAAVSDPYALSNTALYALLPKLDASRHAQPTSLPALNAERRAGDLRLTARAGSGTLTLSAKGLPEGFGQVAFEALVDAVLEKLEEEGKRKG